MARDQRVRPISPRGRPRVRLVAPIAFSSASSACGVVVRQRHVFHVHHRIGEAGVDQHVADVVHVDEAIGMRARRRRRRKAARNLAQRVGAERRERQQPAHLQHAPELGERARQVVHPLQRQVAPDEIARDAGERQRIDVGADELRRAAPRDAQRPQQPAQQRCAARMRAGARGTTIGSAMSSANTRAPG